MWLWKTDIQTNKYLYKWLEQFNRKLYQVFFEQLLWLSFKSSQPCTNTRTQYLLLTLYLIALILHFLLTLLLFLLTSTIFGSFLESGPYDSTSVGG